MAIALKAKTSLSLAATATTITPTIPASPAAGDLMIMWVNIKAPTAGTTNTPAGWTKTPGEKANGNVLVCYYRYWVTGDANPSVTWTTASKASGGMLLFSGVASLANGGPFDATSVSNSGTGTTATFPSITASTKGAYWVMLCGAAVLGAHTAGGHWTTQQVDIASTGGSTSTREESSVYTEPYFANVATGTASTTVASGTWATWSLLLKPAAASAFGRRQRAMNAVTGSTCTVTLPNTPAPGKTILAFILSQTDTITGVTVGDTPMIRADVALPTGYEASLWYLVANSDTGTAVIASKGASSFINLYVEEVDGIVPASSGFDQHGTATGSSTTPSVTTGGAVASGTCLSVNLIGATSQITLTPATGYIGPQATSATESCLYEYKEITGGSTETAAPTIAPTAIWGSVIATFKAQTTPNPSPVFLSAGAPATNSTANTTCTPAIPPDCQNTLTRMLMLISVNGDKTASLNTPTGWTKLNAWANSTNNTLAVYAKWYADGDAAPSVTWTTNAKNTGIILAYDGMDLTTPEDLAATSSTGTSVSGTSPSATALTMGAVRLHIEGRAGTGTSTPDRRMVERADQTTTSTSPAALAVSDEFGMASGALGTRIDTITSAPWVAATLWLRPATPATFGILQSWSTTSGSPQTTQTAAFQNALTSGTNIVAQVANFQGGLSVTQNSCAYGASPVSMSKAASAEQATTNLRIATWYKQNNTHTTADTITVTFSAASDASMTIYEIKGAPLSGTLFDTQGIATATGTAVSVASGATSSGAKLALMMQAPNATEASITSDPRYTFRGVQLSGTNMAFGAQSREFTGGAVETARTILGTSAEWGATLVILLPVGTANAIAGVIAAQSALSLSLAAGITKTPKGIVGSQSAIVCTLTITHSLSPNHIAGQSAVGPVSMASGITKKLSGAAAAQSALSLNIASGITKKLSGSAAAQSALSVTITTTHSLSPNVIAGQSSIGPVSLASGITKKLSGQVAAQSAVGPLSLAAGITKKLSGAIAAQSAIGPLSLASGITKKLGGSVAGQSALTATLLTVHSLSPNHIAGLSAVSASLAMTKKLSGTVASQSSIVASMALVKLLSGSVAAQSGIGPLSLAGGISKNLRAVIAAQSAVGPVSLAGGITKKLSGQVAPQSAIVGTLTTAHLLAGAIAGQSSLACQLSLVKLLNGTVGGQSVIICDLSVINTTKFLAGLIAGQSAVTSSLLLTKPLAGSVVSQSSISASLTLTKPLAALIAAQSNVQSSLTLTKLLAATMPAQSALSCPSLAVARPLSGSVPGQSSVSSSIAVTHFITGTVGGSSHLSSALTLAKLLSGLVGAQATLTCGLTILGTNTLSGTISGHSSIVAALATIKRLAGTVGAQSVITASITPLRPIKGTIAAQSSLSSVLALTKPLMGTVAARSSISGALSASKALSGHIDAHSSLSSLLAASRPLSGSIAAHSAISGGVSTAHYLMGVVAAQSNATASVELVKFLSGLVAGRFSISGALAASRDIAGLIQGVSRITFSLTVMVYSQPIGRIIIIGDISPIRAQGDLLSEGPIQLEGSLGTAEIVGDISPVSGIVGSIRERLEIDT